jgi:hypothetical protein
MWRLLYPFRYFLLVNNEKRNIEIWPTLILAIVISAPFWILNASFFQPNGFLDKILVLTSPLTGFYVAALVAAATFAHPDLDKVITAGSIALITKNADGKRIVEAITRREFICTLFGYLSFSCLIISILAGYFISMSSIHLRILANWPIVGVLFSGIRWLTVRGIVIFGFSLLVAHLIVVTALGIYYLMDRMYRFDRKITTPKPGDKTAAA